MFYAEINNLPGVDKNIITDVQHIPITLKAEIHLASDDDLCITINRVYRHQIYDALWDRNAPNSPSVLTSHRFDWLFHRISFILRYNLYLLRKESFELFMGFGAGLAYYKNTAKISPEYEGYNEEGELSYLRILAAELSAGVRIYPFKHKQLGIMAEVGLMQSFGQLGVSYRLF